MRVRCVLSLLLLFLPIAVAAQDLELSLAAVVRITGTRNGNPVRGSGFVVALSPGAATIVTASHVIEGAQFEVVFSSTTDPFEADGAVLGIESGNPNGLAVFQVRGAIPAGVEVLPLDVKNSPKRGTPLFLVGFPRMSRSPRVKKGIVSGYDGNFLLFDRLAGEGTSGAPLIREDGNAVGVVTGHDGECTRAVKAVVVGAALDGWGVNLCRPGEEKVDNGIVFVRICAGTFTMGSADDDPLANINEKPAHQVTVREFWIGKYEVTNEEYRGLNANHTGKDKLPATKVSRSEAEKFCRAYGFRLPTEAEWEYAARAGTQTPWSFGDNETAVGRYAWYKDNSRKDPHDVGKRDPNPWGLYDMHGNVWEWVADVYSSYSPGPETDPSGPSEGYLGIVRGGGYWVEPGRLRSAFRRTQQPGAQVPNLGFRCVRQPRRQP